MEREHPEVLRARQRNLARVQDEACRAAVARCRAERGIDPHHDSGADSGALSEDEERARSEWAR